MLTPESVELFTQPVTNTPPSGATSVELTARCIVKPNPEPKDTEEGNTSLGGFTYGGMKMAAKTTMTMTARNIDMFLTLFL
jgi:hypothetical protein